MDGKYEIRYEDNKDILSIYFNNFMEFFKFYINRKNKLFI